MYEQPGRRRRRTERAINSDSAPYASAQTHSKLTGAKMWTEWDRFQFELPVNPTTNHHPSKQPLSHTVHFVERTFVATTTTTSDDPVIFYSGWWYCAWLDKASGCVHQTHSKLLEHTLDACRLYSRKIQLAFLYAQPTNTHRNTYKRQSGRMSRHHHGCQRRRRRRHSITTQARPRARAWEYETSDAHVLWAHVEQHAKAPRATQWEREPQQCWWWWNGSSTENRVNGLYTRIQAHNYPKNTHRACHTVRNIYTRAFERWAERVVRPLRNLYTYSGHVALPANGCSK